METVIAKEFGRCTDDEIVALAISSGRPTSSARAAAGPSPPVFDGGSTVVYAVPSPR